MSRVQAGSWFVGGTTNLCGGWQEGGKHVKKHFSQQQVNRVLLLTDGHANVGTTDYYSFEATTAGLAGLATAAEKIDYVLGGLASAINLAAVYSATADSASATLT